MGSEDGFSPSKTIFPFQMQSEYDSGCVTFLVLLDFSSPDVRFAT